MNAEMALTDGHGYLQNNVSHRNFSASDTFSTDTLQRLFPVSLIKGGRLATQNRVNTVT